MVYLIIIHIFINYNCTAFKVSPVYTEGQQSCRLNVVDGIIILVCENVPQS